MVFASTSVSLFLFFIISVLIILFALSIARTYFSDTTLYDKIQQTNRYNEETKSFILPLEPKDGIEISIIHNIDGHDSDEIDDFIQLFKEIDQKLQKIKYEIVLSIKSRDNQIEKELKDFITSNVEKIKFYSTRDTGYSSFVISSFRARGKVIATPESTRTNACYTFRYLYTCKFIAIFKRIVTNICYSA